MSLNGRIKNDFIEKNRKLPIYTNDEEDDDEEGEDIESAVDDDTD